MKVVIGSESFAPNISGVAVAAEHLAIDLAKNGHEVYVFSPSRSFKTHYDKKYKDYKVLRLRSVVNPFRKGFRVAFLPAKDACVELDKIQPDLIHLQDPTSICSSLLKYAKKKHIPVVVTNHFSLDYVISYLRWLKPIHPLLRKVLRSYLSNFYNRCDFVIVPTDTVKKDLQAWGLKSEIEAISNGVNLDRFYSYSSPSSVQMKYHFPPNPIILYVGRIDKDKSIEVMIRAIPKVIEKHNAHFVFAGSGDELPKMRKLVVELGMDRYVAFLGWIDHATDDLPLIYQAATIFAIPSKIETQSIVTLEALASGLPVVAAKAGALPEIVKHKENGFLFKPDNSSEMAEYLNHILDDEKLQEQMKKKSLDIVSDHQIDKHYKRIELAYEGLVKKSKS